MSYANIINNPLFASKEMMESKLSTESLRSNASSKTAGSISSTGTNDSNDSTIIGSIYSDLKNTLTQINLSLDLDLDFIDFSSIEIPKLTFSLPEFSLSSKELSSKNSFSSSSSSLLTGRCPANCAVCALNSLGSVKPKNDWKKNLDPRYLRNTYCPFEKARQRRDRRVAMQRYEREFTVIPWSDGADLGLHVQRPMTAA